MTESEEQAYLQGKRQAALELMQLSLSMVGREHITDAQKLECERAETVRKLREICEIHGDNDWEDNFHLADVLERHLFDHLEECPDELDPRELAEAVGGEYQSVVRAAALVTAQACLFKSGFRDHGEFQRSFVQLVEAMDECQHPVDRSFKLLGRVKALVRKYQ